MKNTIYFLISLLFLFTTSCSSDANSDSQEVSDSEEMENPEPTEDPEPMEESLYFPPTDADIWNEVTFETLDWNETEEQPLYDLLEGNGTDAFIILKNGKIVLEWYFGEFTKDSNHTWNSAAKTLTAMMVGIAQEEGFLNIEDPTSDFLGEGWSSMTIEQEKNITIRSQLTMTSGLDYTDEIFCYDPECLTYLNEPGTTWYYHNAPYTLLDQVLSNATNIDFKDYFKDRIGSKIGMTGQWVNVGYNNLFFSDIRSMARYGLLALNQGNWNGTPILEDTEYFTNMTNTSQELNPAYGYLWWLNGKDTYRAPSSELEFNGKLINNAPDDLIAGLGAFDQKLYVVPSQKLVVVRFGDDTGASQLGPSSFDETLWERISSITDKD
ncbi:CubicO group peptidase (beta-lactamase class C family) [Flavobacteriaceae bacterium MAR_2009_75]|nr:CubicO group peptidase (beta-lactamase class C family) [Flavobacteriaceae bacterium MAR_2009_75]